MTVATTPARLAVLISGSGSNLQALIDHIESGNLNAEIAVVISNKADAYGLQRAQKHNIQREVIPASRIESRQNYDQRLATIIDQYDTDVILLAGFMRILSDEFVNRYLGRMLNIHPSLLPKHKGLNTHQRALEAGDKQHGASVHFVTPTLDDGPIIMQAAIDIQPEDTNDSLAGRILKEEHKLYAEALKLYLDERIKFSNGNVLFDNKSLTTPLILGA